MTTTKESPILRLTELERLNNDPVYYQRTPEGGVKVEDMEGDTIIVFPMDLNILTAHSIRRLIDFVLDARDSSFAYGKEIGRQDQQYELAKLLGLSQAWMDDRA